MTWLSSAGNSGAILRWGNYLDNGVWIDWRYWQSLKMMTRFKIKHGYLACSILSMRWGNV